MQTSGEKSTNERLSKRHVLYCYNIYNTHTRMRARRISFTYTLTHTCINNVIHILHDRIITVTAETQQNSGTVRIPTHPLNNLWQMSHAKPATFGAPASDPFCTDVYKIWRKHESNRGAFSLFFRRFRARPSGPVNNLSSARRIIIVIIEKQLVCTDFVQVEPHTIRWRSG